jgi:polyphosphate kinase
VNLSRVQEIYELVERPDLKFTPYKASIPAQLARNKNYFEAIKKQDILLHHPYESFSPVVEFIRQAAVEPYTTLTAASCSFAARVILAFSSKRARSSITTVTSFPPLAAFSKALIIGESELVRYKTGNYHPKTAQFYTDYGLFSSSKEIGEDVRKIFVQLTSLGKVTKLNKLLQSPFTLHKEAFTFNRKTNLYPPKHIAVHQVRTGCINLLISAILKHIHPGMLKNGSYVQCVPEDDVFRVQNELMEQYSVK